MSIRKGDWIQVYTGGKFYPEDPQPEDIYIEDIAHALSLQCRFGGHCESFYSVAQHSYTVSNLLPQEYKLWGLLHDAAEAYYMDIPRPIKPLLPEYLRLEKLCEQTIAKTFDLPYPIPPIVKYVDSVLLKLEHQIFIKNHHIWAVDEIEINLDWLVDSGLEHSPIEHAWTPGEAEQRFLHRYHILTDV